MKLYRFITFVFLAVVALTSCKKRGCTDYEALNYDPEAKQDDNTCYYFWIGQNYQGGKIFYIDRSRKHGLIALPNSLNNGSPIKWGCQNIYLDQNDSDQVGKGSSNSQTIYDVCGSNTAAGRCLDLDTLGFHDWYMPSMEEMRGFVLNLAQIGQAIEPNADSYYWTSSQVDTNTAYAVHPNGASVIFNKGQAYTVRPIRAF